MEAKEKNKRVKKIIEDVKKLDTSPEGEEAVKELEDLLSPEPIEKKVFLGYHPLSGAEVYLE